MKTKTLTVDYYYWSGNGENNLRKRVDKANEILRKYYYAEMVSYEVMQPRKGFYSNSCGETITVYLIDIKLNIPDIFVTTDFDYICTIKLISKELDKKENYEIHSYSTTLTYDEVETIRNTYVGDWLHCDHCEQNRQRRIVHIFRKKSTQEILSIGKSCAVEYFGVDISELVRISQKLYQLFGGEDFDEFVFDNSPRFIDKYEERDKRMKALFWGMYNHFVVEGREFVSKSKAYNKGVYSTSDFFTGDIDRALYNVMYGRDNDKLEYKYLTNRFPEIDKWKNVDNLFVDFINWGERLRDYKIFEENSFIRNIYEMIITRSYNKIGLFTYAVFAYINNEIQDEEEKKEENIKPSEFQGKIGEKLEVDVTVVTSIWIDNNYGGSRLIKLIDDNNNVYITFTTSDAWCSLYYSNVNEGSRVRVRGTVKEHTVYEGKNQTRLIRCKPLELVKK